MTKLAVLLRTSFFILLAICVTNANANSQNQKVTISANSETLQKIFKEIKKQTGLIVFYSDALINDKEKITINVKEEALSSVLDKVIAGKPLKYEIQDKYIVISAKLPQTTPNVPSPNETAAPPPANIDVTVTVVAAENNQTLEGASVAVKGSNKGVATDVNGRAVLKDVDAGATIIISFTGYASQEIKISSSPGFKPGVNSPGNPAAIVVKLIASTNELNEVVINKGYYTEKQRFSVGNVTKISGEDIQKQPVSNPLLALEGRVPGLFITQTSGVAGSMVKVRVQGQNSIIKGNNPLYIVDGVPLMTEFPGTGIDGIFGSDGQGTGNPLNYINPSDIESIEILKDADATAIYGSRAANGAILITTKKGKVGKIKLGLNLQQGWGTVTRKMDMMNTQQYLEMRREAFKNDNKTPAIGDYDVNGTWDTTRYTDWQKMLIGNRAQYTNLTASISGGSQELQYLLSGTYHRETTVFPFPSDFSDQKGAFHLSLTSTSDNKKLRLQFSSNYSFDKNQLPQTDLTQKAIQLEPNAPMLYNADGSLNWAQNSLGTSTWDNPLKYIYLKYQNSTTNFINNASLNYKILPGLEFHTSFGYTIMKTDDYFPGPAIGIKPENRSNYTRQAGYGSRNISSWIIEPQATYAHDVWKGKLEVLLGSTILQNDTKGSNIFGYGFSSDGLLENISAATSWSLGETYIMRYKYNALFGRLNYNLKNRYIINLTSRRDGSSRFGAYDQFHNFGSIGAAWIFTEENFLNHNSFLSFGKLKGSYGTTGSDQIGDYKFLNIYSIPSIPGGIYQGISPLSPSGLTNPYLQWEETQKLQGGIDLGLLKDRILISATYAQNRCSNQLLFYLLPGITGFSSLTANFPATIQNTSWEFTVQTKNVSANKFSWNTTFNLTVPKNKLLSFPNIDKSSYAASLIVGQPRDVMKITHFLGVDPLTGRYQFDDGHGSVTNSPTFPDSYTRLVSTFPKYYGGFQNRVTFKSFELDFLFQFVKQVGPNMIFYNGSAGPGVFSNGRSNQPAALLNRWQKPGDQVLIARYTTNSSATSDASLASGSDAIYLDASFVRLKNLSVSWELPESWKKKASFQTCRLYIQGQNLLTITNYKGMDPENQSIFSLPPLCVWTFGLQLGL